MYSSDTYTPAEVMLILRGETGTTDEQLDLEIALFKLSPEMRCVAESYREGFSMDEAMAKANVTGNSSRYLATVQNTLTGLMNGSDAPPKGEGADNV